MEIKKGERYKCIKDYLMRDGSVAFTLGKNYDSPSNNFLINDFGNLHQSASIISSFFEIVHNAPSTERPSHYGGDENPHEPIKIIQHYGLSFELGNVIKYVLRADKKGCREDDLKKAMQYLQFEIDKNK